MPIFTFIQVVMTRVIFGIAAILTVLGIGSITEPPISDVNQQNEYTEIAKIDNKNNIQEIPQKDLKNSLEEFFPLIQEGDIEKETEEKTGGETGIGNEKTLVTGTHPTDNILENSKTTDKQLVKERPNGQLAQQATSTEQVTSSYTSITSSSSAQLSFADINTETTKALVNVLCTTSSGGPVQPITGSGVIIDPSGVVITNAHVAQFYLLKNYPSPNALNCILRTGSPARATYTAEVMYLPTVWMEEHASDITLSNPVGTGEYDFAFLYITGRTDPTAILPGTFPFVKIETDDSKVVVGNSVLATAYPAGFLGGISIQKDLYAVSAIATIGERFTFKQNTIDLFSTGGTVVSQGGSSGGAIVSDENKLLGIIVTSTREMTTTERDLRAITLGHINRSLIDDTGFGIDALLSGNLPLKTQFFNLTTSPTLTNLLIQNL